MHTILPGEATGPKRHRRVSFTLTEDPSSTLALSDIIEALSNTFFSEHPLRLVPGCTVEERPAP